MTFLLVLYIVFAPLLLPILALERLTRGWRGRAS
jgi:hypothetical protein